MLSALRFVSVTDEQVAGAKKQLLSDVYTLMEDPLQLVENMGAQALVSGDVMPVERSSPASPPPMFRPPLRSWQALSWLWEPWVTSPLCPIWMRYKLREQFLLVLRKQKSLSC